MATKEQIESLKQYAKDNKDKYPIANEKLNGRISNKEANKRKAENSLQNWSGVIVKNKGK